MKIWKLMGKRGFAVFTSLALCASLVAPTFAATFTDLNNAITGEASGVALDNGYTGYGKNEADGYDIWAKDATGKDGATIREILLQGNVTRTEQSQGSIKIVKNDNVTLDLNGKTINGNKAEGMTGSVIHVNGGQLTINDSSGDDSGKITGGNKTDGNGGGGIFIESGSVTLNGGTITDNNAKANGGGVGVGKNGDLGAGKGASFIMTGGKISGNTAGNTGGDGGGGGVWVKNGANFTMTNGEITGNKVTNNGGQGNGGGVAIHQATFTMEGGKIYGNEAPRGTGVLISAGGGTKGDASFTMSGGYVSGDKGTSCIYMEEKDSKGLEGGASTGQATLTLQGKAVLDGSIRLGQGAQVITDNVMQPDGTHPYTSFDVTDTAGNKVDTSSITGIEGSTTIGPDQTGIEKGGYQCDTQDLLLDIQYDHDFGKDWSSDGEKTHSHHCEYCSETSGTTDHNWDGGKVTTPATETEDGVKTFTCKDCGATKTEEIDFTGGGSGSGGGSGGGDLTFIDEPDVPLAGLFTRADAIGYLWEQAGSPDAELSDFPDVPEDHQWAVAIGWAQDVGIALPDLEGSFRPDDLVLRSVEDIELSPEGELEEFLNRYAVYAGIELDAGELFIELAGEWDDVIMGEDAQVIFDDFFARLEAALAEQAA